jgi:hypothetical protein
MTGRARLASLLLTSIAFGCTAPPGTAATAALPQPVSEDTTSRTLVPPGFGSLRQDDIAIRLTPPGFIVRAIPLEEGVIRLLTPDSYRALRELQESNRQAIANITRRSGGRPPDLWYVSFFGVQPEARFIAMDLIINSAGQDFRPLEIFPLTTGFGEQRLHQRETQSAVYVFPGEVDVDHPLSVTFPGERNTSWEQILQRIERERALVRARAGHGGSR